MKKILYMIILVIASSCEDVIEVDLETAVPRLVIDASINWPKGTPGNQQVVRLTTTTGYFQESVPKVSGAVIFITNSSGSTFNFVETTLGKGEYVCNDFVPIIGERYTLTVTHEGQTYAAEETLFAAPEILDVEQQDNLGLNNNEIGLKARFKDNGSEENFYLVRFDTPVNPFPEYLALEDRFNQGNDMFGFYSHEDLKSGTPINFTLFGTSRQYYKYMMRIIAITVNDGGPFQTPPSTVRGNLVNQTNPENFALGYFNLSETTQQLYIVE